MNITLLKNIGLNIVASIEMTKLPADILNVFDTQNIPYSDQDILYIVGHGGRDLWENLTHPLDNNLHHFDNFTIEQMKTLDPHQQVIFPHPTWNIPLQKIGRLLNISKQSLLGIDINKEFGLWFAYRGVFLSKIKIKTEQYEDFNLPCEACVTKPCISACPASAVTLNGNSFKSKDCIDHQLKDNSNCEDRCLARLACPFQNKHQYKQEQIVYHIKSRTHLTKALQKV